MGDSTPSPVTSQGLYPQTISNTRAYLSIIAGVICISFSPIFVKTAATYGDVVGFYRMGIAALALSIPMLVHWRRGQARLPRRAIWLGVLAGLAFAADMALWSTALEKLTSANATLLGNTAPLWVGLGAWLIFREKLRPIYWLGLVIALAGVVSIIGLDALRGLGTDQANLLGLGAGLAYASYQLITQPARQHIDNLTYLWLFSAVSAAALGLFVLALRHPITGLPLNSYLALLGLGLFSHVGGWLLINYALGHLRASLVSVTLLAQPIFVALLAMPLLGEIPTAWHLIGGLITLTGIYIVHRSMTKSDKVMR